MGYLVYGAGAEYEFADELLAHVKVAVLYKLRAQESFLLNWEIGAKHGSGRISLWMSPGVPLIFRFRGLEPTALDRSWVDGLIRASYGARGMSVIGREDARRYLEEP